VNVGADSTGFAAGTDPNMKGAGVGVELVGALTVSDLPNEKGAIVVVVGVVDGREPKENDAGAVVVGGRDVFSRVLMESPKEI
jgi:hypothetical protein